jgi:uncharacterized membrane protein
MNKLIQFWGNLRSSFWFMPSLMVAASIALAVVLIESNSAGYNLWLSQWPLLFGVGVFIYFIHHIASPIQTSSIIASVAQETNASQV